MKYTVTVTRTEWTTVEVEADDEIDARAKGYQEAIIDNPDEQDWETSNIDTKV